MKKNFLKTVLAAAVMAVGGASSTLAQDSNGYYYDPATTPAGYYYVVTGWNNNYALASNNIGQPFVETLDQNDCRFIWYLAPNNKAKDTAGTAIGNSAFYLYWGNPAWEYALAQGGGSNGAANISTTAGGGGLFGWTDAGTKVDGQETFRWNCNNQTIGSHQRDFSPESETAAPPQRLYSYGNRNNYARWHFLPVPSEISDQLASSSAQNVMNGTAVTSLSQIEEGTAFYISTNGRQGFVAKADGTGLQGTGSDAHRLFYIIKKAGSTDKYYFYNEALEKFLTRNLGLSDLGDAFEISESATPDGEYKWAIKFDDDHNINNSGNANGANYKVSNYSAPDAGNRFRIGIPAGRTFTKKSEAETKIAEFKDITYKAIFNDEVVKTLNITHHEGDAVSVGTLPTEFTSVPFCDFATDISEIAAGTTEVNITVTWQTSAPYKLSTKAAPRYYTWQNKGQTMSVVASSDTQKNDYGNSNSLDGSYTPTYNRTGNIVYIQSGYSNDDNAQWAFIGNPYKIEVVNKAYPGKFLMYRNKLNGNSSNSQLLLFDEDEDSDGEADYIFYWSIVDWSTGGNAYIAFGNGNNFFVKDDGGKLNNKQCPGMQNGGNGDASRYVVTEVVSSYTVNYEVWYEGSKVNEAAAVVAEGTTPSIPTSLNVDYTELAMREGTPATITANTTVYVDATFTPPFTLGSYYNFMMRPNDPRYVQSGSTNNVTAANLNRSDLLTDSYQWQFTGNPYAIKVTSKDGKVITLNNESNNGSLVDNGDFTFTIVRYNDTDFRLTGNGINGGENYLADYTANAVIGRWSADAGTVLRAVELPVALTVTDAGYATFASDKALDFTGVTDVKAYRAEKDGDMINFVQITGAVPAGEGLLIKGTAGTEVNTAIPVATGTPEDITNVFEGTLVDKVLEQGDYILYGTKFYVVGTKTVTLPAGKAYIPKAVAAGARIASLDFEETTGVANVNVNDNDNRYYDLQGRQIVNGKSVNSKLQRGLYIVNGKKVVVK